MKNTTINGNGIQLSLFWLSPNMILLDLVRLL